MDKFTLTINLDRIDQDRIWKNKQGERCISANLVHSPKTWDSGDESWGFLAQWWKDDTLPQGEYPKHPILGNAKHFKKQEQVQDSQETPGLSGSPF